jgi:hypothetical protein
MKNFNLFLAFLVCSSVAFAATPVVPAAAASKEVVAPATATEAPKASMFETVTGYVKAPFTKAQDLLNAVNAKTLELEKAAASKVAANTPAAVSTTTSTVVNFIANNQVTLVLAAAATYGLYAYATSNSADKKSKN